MYVCIYAPNYFLLLKLESLVGYFLACLYVNCCHLSFCTLSFCSLYEDLVNTSVFVV